MDHAEPGGLSPVGGISWPMVTAIRATWLCAVDGLDHSGLDGLACRHGHLLGAAPLCAPRRAECADEVDTAGATLHGRRHHLITAAGALPATRLSLGC